MVYIPARLDSVQCEKLTPAIEQLFANSVNWITRSTIPIQIKADETIGVTLFEQSDRWILHLVNHNADTMKDYDQIGPVKNIKIKISVPDGRKVARLHLLRQEAELKFDDTGQWVESTLPELGVYKVVVAEFK